MQELSILFEDILNENPNQAIKFLKDKKLDPGTNNKGKQILDSILNITRGDGFTFLLTKIHINERMPFNELQQLHTYLRQHKNELSRLPQPVVNYETYRGLMNDIDNLFGDIKTNWLLKQLSATLRQQAQSLNAQETAKLSHLAKSFGMLKPEDQRHFMKKVFSFKDIHTFMDNITRYMIEVANKQDYNTTKEKIETTTGAFLAYDNPQQDILIAHINSFEAMKALGCTSAWCIARDMARYRQYKTGGNYYFLIWDYNYPINDSNFFIATAYNPNTPIKSKTHEHINDRSLVLPDVLEQKKLDENIFINYIEKFKKSREKYEGYSELAKALGKNDTDALIVLLQNSATIQKYQTYTPTVNWSREKIEIGIDKEGMKKMLELGDEFDYINSVGSYYSNSSDYYESEEANYMHGALSQENIKLLVQLAKTLGVPRSIYNKFKNTENVIAKFLEQYELNNLIETYLSEYAEAGSEAEKNAAKELLGKIPFDVDDGTFKIDEMYEYYIDNELTANNFDELIEQIKNILPSFDYDSISEARYNDMDLDELNRAFKEKLTNIIDDIETDEDNPIYVRARMLRDANEFLQKLGFKLMHDTDNVAKLSTKLGTIIINKVEMENEEDPTSRIMVTAKLWPRGSRNGWKIKVPLTSIKNYIYQLQLPLQERLLTFKKILAEIAQ
jgi:hypothetical protein